MKYTYPVAKPDHAGRERGYLVDAIESGWTSSAGSYIPLFEVAFAKRMGAKYAVACSSGTAALTIALRALGIGEGDEVIVPEFTMIASAWAVTYTGAKPVFVDCADDLNIDIEKIEAAITPKTKAIMPVHIYGRPVLMTKIMKIAKKYNLFVVEDCAEAHGAMVGDKCVGTFGNIGCFSLFANKIITSGEGGVCITDSEEMYEEMVKLRSMYFNPEHTFLHPKIGYNFRMTNLQGAVAYAQIQRMDEFLAKRREIMEWYDEIIGEHTIPRPKGSVLWMYDVVVDSDDREKIRDGMAMDGIETRVFFKPMSQQPMYRDDSYIRLNAHAYAEAGFYLPSYTRLTRRDVQIICQSFLKHLLRQK